MKYIEIASAALVGAIIFGVCEHYITLIFEVARR